VVFFPFEQPLSAPFGYTFAEYAHREIIDIRQANEFTISVPYVSTRPFKSADTSDGPFGWLDIYVLDELVAPASVSTTINFLTEVSAGPDFEWAVPIVPNITPVIGVTPQSGNIFKGKPQENVCSIINSTIGGAPDPQDQIVNSASCVGEKIRNFRALIKSFNLKPPVAAPTPDIYVNVVPYLVNVFFDRAVFANPPTSSDLYDVLSSIFAIARGGVRLKFFTQNAATQVNNTCAYILPTNTSDLADVSFVTYNATDARGTNTYTNQLCTPQVYMNTQYDGAIELNIPQYHTMHSRASASLFADNGVGATTKYEQAALSLAPKIRVSITQGGSTTTNGILARAGSEDFNMGSFVSIPPFVQGITTEARI